VISDDGIKRDMEERLALLKDLLRLEEAEEEARFRGNTAGLSPQEQERRGYALLDLEIVSTGAGPGGHALVELERRDGKDLPAYSFEAGEGAVLFPKKIDMKRYPTGVIYERTARRVTLALRRPLSEEIEDLPSFCLFKSAHSATYQFMREALEEVSQVRDSTAGNLLRVAAGLKKAEPAFDLDAGLTFHNPGLNASQKHAVRTALANPQIALIHGPPGTGKTTVLVEIVRHAVEKKASVYVCAPSNTACDNLLAKIAAAGMEALRTGHPARIAEDLRRHTLGFKAKAHALNKDLESADRELAKLFRKINRLRERGGAGREKIRELHEEITARRVELNEIRRQIFRDVTARAQVSVGTLTGIYDAAAKKGDFDLVVMDEATQATEPLSWVALVKAKKVVMAGDPMQLPPTVLSHEAERKGLGVTLFERLYRRLGEGHKTLLDRQYRMHEHIMKFSSRMFYEDKLIADESVRGHRLADLAGVVSDGLTGGVVDFIDTAGAGFEEVLEPGSESRYNPEEVRVIAGLVRKFLELGVPAGAMAVIAPYSAQVRRLCRALPDEAVEVDTVDGFQGREKELVLISCVRSNTGGDLGFLADRRRMNVALTRARRRLIVVGDSATLADLPFFRKFVEYSESIGGYRSVWEMP